MLGAHGQHEFHEILRRVALDIEFRFHERTQQEHVGVTYVPLVGARMHGDTVSTKPLAVNGKLLYVGHVLSTGIAQGGHFVDINTELCHCTILSVNFADWIYIRKFVLKLNAKVLRIFLMTKELLPKDAHSSEIARLFPPLTDESRLLVECKKAQYSASIITRAIEDCDAQVMNLNVTSFGESSVMVEVRVNRLTTDSICRSLARYGYEVIDTTAASDADNERLRLRATELLRYLEM